MASEVQAEPGRPGAPDPKPRIRLLCLGNELLADDKSSYVVAGGGWRWPDVEVVFTSESGLHLIDYLTETDLLIVVDTIQVGSVPPGTIYVLQPADIESASGPSPHYMGLSETLQLARKLLLEVPKEVIILAVEAADCLTVGGAMHEAVSKSVELVIDVVNEIIHEWEAAPLGPGADFVVGRKRAIAAATARWGSERLMAV